MKQSQCKISLQSLEHTDNNNIQIVVMAWYVFTDGDTAKVHNQDTRNDVGLSPKS